MARAAAAEDSSASSNLNVKLGSTLFEIEKTRTSQTRTFYTGIKSLDVHFGDLFSGGKVVGIGHVDYDVEQTLSTHLIASHLLKHASTLSPSSTSTSELPPPSTFIITPPSTPTITTLHSLLQHHLALTPSLTTITTTTGPESTSLSLLSSVSLLQYLDLPGLIESLAEVAQHLHVRSQQLSSTATLSSSAPSSPPQPAILLIQGLSTTLSEMYRRRGTTQTCALLMGLMRRLRGVSRMYPHLLVIVEVGVDIVVGGRAGDGVGNMGGGQVESAFASVDGKVMQMVPRGVVGGVIEAMVDVVVCVHDAFGRGRGDGREVGVKRSKVEEQRRGTTLVVEVVKDKVGGKMGEWAIWAQ